MATELPTPHGSRQTNAYVCLFITFVAAAIAITLRLVARRLMKVSLWLDDYFAVAAFLFACVWNGLLIWWLHSGFGLFLIEIDMPAEVTLERSRLILWNAELFYAFSLGSAKLAILGFYWRMFRTSKLRLPIQILAGSTIVWLILRTFLAIFHCVPVAKFWRPSILGHCAIDDSRFFFGTVLVHLIIDIVILALPVIEVRKLQLPLTQRLGIIAMFGFGIFVCVASVVVMVLSVGYDGHGNELPWNVAPIIIWATAEVNLAIVSACLPILRPIYLVILGRPLTRQSSHSKSYAQSKSRFPPLSNPHRLGTLTNHKDLNETETESIRKLASRVSITSSTSDFERGGHGNMTVVGVGSGDERVDEEQRTVSRGLTIGRGSVKKGSESKRSSISNAAGDSGWNSFGGIVVTNEMSVRSDRVA
ncbi:hypothetical protein K458DRAFT_89504 [Lentithecium fluviatile CBS 122367]|uniref:Rhodopsin domain-containing protein n=1 Tax=Lentithecium fluviatile CBS 122367 TaxID=1168545 RepID=A0A6G1IRQ0_9PLEO|nr:hypothetical protein K458DRAFT_89504 [Lentithecium fluviatile CBS 122367]